MSILIRDDENCWKFPFSEKGDRSIFQKLVHKQTWSLIRSLTRQEIIKEWTVCYPLSCLLILYSSANSSTRPGEGAKKRRDPLFFLNHDAYIFVCKAWRQWNRDTFGRKRCNEVWSGIEFDFHAFVVPSRESFLQKLSKIL